MSSNSIGYRIKDARKQAGLTQAELAEYVRVSKSSIAQYENNKIKPSYNVLIRIAEKCKKPVQHLLIGEDVAYENAKTLYINEQKNLAPVIGSNIQKAREARNISRTEFAQCVEISEDELSSYERGEVLVPLYELIQIAKQFYVTLDWLVGRDDISHPFPDDSQVYDQVTNFSVAERQLYGRLHSRPQYIQVFLKLLKSYDDVDNTLNELRDLSKNNSKETPDIF